MMQRLHEIASRFVAPAVDYWTLRLVQKDSEHLCVRQGVAEPSALSSELGVMVTVVAGAGVGWAATSDPSPAGLSAAATRARDWARAHAARGLFDAALYPRSTLRSVYQSAVLEPWHARSLDDKLALLADACSALEVDGRICDAIAWVDYRRVNQLFITAEGGCVEQAIEIVAPGIEAIASDRSQTQCRRGGGHDRFRQGGLERLDEANLIADAERVAHEALALLDAPECPSGRYDLVLLPSQMVLQIHESIGHPLELDRILGDERNYAGSSFVTPEMFGTYQYGSALLNVTFDPTEPGELASYVADDEGTLARREYLIRDGLLVRPLGSALSQARAGLPGVANARASTWDRPPIDRMANINLEPGDSTLDELIADVEQGILMDTNRSWSIDDNRNKFQFSCEVGYWIEDGERAGMVRNPGYRGISAAFWRSLDGVGDAASREVRGVHNCGKGEPNQVIQVGHATPPCRFRQVDIFGGGR